MRGVIWWGIEGNQGAVAGTTEVAKQEAAAEGHAAKPNRFLIAFRNKSTLELQTIVAENRLVPEAIQAAKELLALRKGI